MTREVLIHGSGHFKGRLYRKGEIQELATHAEILDIHKSMGLGSNGHKWLELKLEPNWVRSNRPQAPQKTEPDPTSNRQVKKKGGKAAAELKKEQKKRKAAVEQHIPRLPGFPARGDEVNLEKISVCHIRAIGSPPDATDDEVKEAFATSTARPLHVDLSTRASHDDDKVLLNTFMTPEQVETVIDRFDEKQGGRRGVQTVCYSRLWGALP